MPLSARDICFNPWRSLSSANSTNLVFLDITAHYEVSKWSNRTHLCLTINTIADVLIWLLIINEVTDLKCLKRLNCSQNKQSRHSYTSDIGTAVSNREIFNCHRWIYFVIIYVDKYLFMEINRNGNRLPRLSRRHGHISDTKWAQFFDSKMKNQHQQ